MILAIRQLLTRIFGSEEVDQRYSVVDASPGTAPWEHYFPREQRDEPASGASDRDLTRARREPILQGK